ncbi:LacI family DNA-binding transcriptional regulator [Aestuariimicrobium soli]|uniref:LacI family DNA-binding transcriptional regulator n=1 Tax=Aestuariimicrobium soli TaxID=2035834 RepID=UPI003EBB659A
MVSVRDVAAEAGVSVGTVSHALNHPDRVSADNLARVQAAIERLGFVRNEGARQLRAGRSRSLGLVVLDAGNPFFAEVARGAELAAADAGLTVLVGNSVEDPTRESAYLDLFDEQRVSGVLITPTTDDPTRLQRLQSRGIPVVLVDRELADSGAPGFSSVAVNDTLGGDLAAGHLLSRGRRRLAFIGGPLSLPQVSHRLEGARAAVARHPEATIEVIERAALTVLEGRAAAESLLTRAPERRPDALFCANDLLAVGALQALVMGGGVRVPDDLALVGYDDIDFAAATVVPLTSVRQPAREIGRSAVELLVRQLADPQSGPQVVRFDPELVVRESS